MRTIILCIFTITILILAENNCSGQLSGDLKCAKSLFAPEKKIDYTELAKGNKNEIESTFSVLFVFYKKFISSQDIDACVFYPSCSVFAIDCIHHEKHKLIAFLKISDRVLRCHPFVSPGTYKIDNVTGKFLDPIEN